MPMSEYDKGYFAGFNNKPMSKKPTSEWHRGHCDGCEERRKETLKDHQADRRVFAEERERREQAELKKLFPDSKNFNPSAENADDSIEETK